MPYTHLTRMILKQVQKYGDKPALYYKNEKDWKSISWREMGKQIEAVSKALLKFGLDAGGRAAIFSQNRPQWTIADYGIMGIRGITTTIYATNSAAEAEYIVNDAEVRILFVGGQEQYDKIMTFFPSNQFLKRVVVFDPTVDIGSRTDVLYFSRFIKEGLEAGNENAFKERLKSAGPQDTAAIIYTSGTSGIPKGVMLSQNNICSQAEVLDPLFNIDEHDIELCFLPFSHVYQKTSTHWTQSHGVTVYYCDRPKEILEYFKEVRPTFMVGVPRLYEKMYAAVYARLEQASALKNGLFHWAIKTGSAYQYKKFRQDPISPVLKLKHKAARILVLNKIRAIMGGRLNFFSAGGAPLAREIEEFFFAAGIFIAQGYGLTETAPVISCNRPDKFKFGTPGTVVKGCSVQIADDGEILVKGPNVMKGYFRKPELTAEVLSEDGWFKTGDMGFIDEEGFLHITDRKKDIIITAGGKNIAPQGIESLFGKDYYIEQIALIGDKRKYLTALVVPSAEAVAELAAKNSIVYDSLEDLLGQEEIIAFFAERIDAITAELARYEKIQKFTLISEPFSTENGEITPTLKIKRKVLEEHYKDTIELMYAEG